MDEKDAKEAGKQKVPVGGKLIMGVFGVTAVFAAVCMAVVFIYTAITKSSSDGTTIAQQVIKEMKLNALTYSYTDSIFIAEPEEWKLFGLIDIDPGVRYLAVQYNGVLRLGIDMGIDAKDLDITEQGVNEEGKRILNIVLPEVIEISHEQFRNDEVTVVQDGKYTKKEVSREELNKAYEERKAYYSENAHSMGLYEEAKESAISQIANFLNLIPDIQENYVITWN